MNRKTIIESEDYLRIVIDQDLLNKRFFSRFFLPLTKVFEKEKLLKISLPNFKYPIYIRAQTSDILNAEEIFINGDYNFNFPENITRIIDAGANIGFASIFFSKIFENAKILALEPEKSNFSMLKRNVTFYKNIKTLNKALWAKEANLSILQILPINDTTANYTWTDSYPYAAISVYALHPQYLSLEKLDFALPKELVQQYNVQKTELNSLNLIDYEKMIAGKWKFVSAVFELHQNEILKDRNFKKFIKDNEEWLLPYAAFCVQRDKYNTPNFNLWKTHKKYIAGKIAPFFSPKSKDFDAAMLHAWVQYQLHLQLKDAIDYTHRLGISVKGDLPIGIYRYSVEAWTEPELFGMDFQAGAPPDPSALA